MKCRHCNDTDEQLHWEQGNHVIIWKFTWNLSGVSPPVPAKPKNGQSTITMAHFTFFWEKNNKHITWHTTVHILLT